MKKKLTKIALCFAIALAMLFSYLAMPISSIVLASYTPSSSEIERPSSLTEGLSRKTLDELLGKRVTIRQPQMKVLERNIHRTAPEVLSNTFTLPNFATGEMTNASITFDKYPGKGQGNQTFSNFEKYMLLREVFWYNKTAMEDAKNGTLKKHPAADLQYGELEVKDNAVKKWILTDPEYKSPMTTGLYLAPGEVTEVEVKGLKPGESVTLYTHHQSTMGYANGDVNSYFNRLDNLIIEESKKDHPNYEGLNIDLNGQYARQNEEIPAMGATFVLTENTTYKIGCPFGGILYVKPTTSPTELTITGAVETPHFILGVTTVSEFEDTLRSAPGLFAVLDTENGQLIGPSDAMRNTDDIQKLAYFWHSAFAVDTSFNGRAYNYNVTLSFDTHVPAGSAVALSSDRAAMPVGWFSVCMNYGKLTTEGQWGTFHELGHIHAKAYDMNWGMRENGEGEVWNNTLIILIYALLCNMDGRVNSIEHGEFVHPYTTLQYIENHPIATDYKNADYFQMLSLYATLIHSFSPETFVDFLYTYSEVTKYCDNSRADFAYRIARVTNMNIVKWLNRVYKANIDDSMFDSNQLKFMNSLKNFYPIAYTYANGTNQFETARKHEVDFSNPTVFDFSGDNIICPVAYEIISFTNPLHGTIKVSDDNTKVTYTPPSGKVFESDEFFARVRIKSTGVDVYLPVRFNFGYTNAYTTVWDDIGTQDITAAEEYSKTHDPSYTKVENYSGVKQYNANVNGKSFKSYLTTKFKFVATTSGEHKFYTRSDDSSKVTFTKDGVELGSLSINGDRSSYNANAFVSANLNVGDIVEIETKHVNYGGICYLTVGVMFPESSSIVEIPTANRLNYNMDTSKLEETKDFGWEPKFFVSIKNAYKSTAVSKSGWKVLEAPENQATDNGKENMIDGNNSTIYHGKYNPTSNPFPHTFIFDTGAEQNLNYFEIITRNNGNSYIKEMKLLGSKDNKDYQVLFSTTSLSYTNLKATIDFEETTLRYFKLDVYSATSNGGKDFVVIAEVNAGLKAKMEQPLKPSTLESETTGFETNDFGELSTKTANSVFTFEFTGTGFDVFANKAPDFGSAKVYIDDHEAGTINLNGERVINCVVFSIKELISKKHTVRIETQDNAEFNISFLNVSYGVDTGEEVVPPPEKIVPTESEHYVGGHTFNEKVVITPEPDEVVETAPETSESTGTQTPQNPSNSNTGSQSSSSGGTSQEGETTSNNKIVLIICIACASAVVLFIGGLAIYKISHSNKKKKSR